MLAALLTTAAAAAEPALLNAAAAAKPIALVTGATGRTGSLLYGLLKADASYGEVRGLVTDLAKAKQVLNCSRCDASEGVYLGNVTNSSTLAPAMTSVSTLFICVGASPDDSPAEQKAVEWTGVQNQVALLAMSTAAATKQVLLISSMGTTQPSPDPKEGGSILFWKLQAEAFIMASGVPYTIVKPCGLLKPLRAHTLLVGHDDALLSTSPPIVGRAAVATVLYHAAALRATSLRFDLCSKAGPATTNFAALFTAAAYPWQRGAAVALEAPLTEDA